MSASIVINKSSGVVKEVTMVVVSDEDTSFKIRIDSAEDDVTVRWIDNCPVEAVLIGVAAYAEKLVASCEEAVSQRDAVSREDTEG